MTIRVEQSEAKFKIRYNAQLLNSFTVEELVHATGLNPESVRTELQRMKKDGFVTSHPYTKSSKKRGGRPALYQLTSDSRLRRALLASINAFLAINPPSEQPTSRHYLLAQQLLDQAFAVGTPERTALIAEAEEALEMAEQASDGIITPTFSKPYFHYEYGRIAYLRGDDEEAEKCFATAYSFFNANGVESKVRTIKEFQLLISARRNVARDMEGDVDQNAWLTNLLAITVETPVPNASPLASMLLGSLRDLLEADAFASAGKAQSVKVGQDISGHQKGQELVLEHVLGDVPLDTVSFTSSAQVQSLQSIFTETTSSGELSFGFINLENLDYNSELDSIDKIETTRPKEIQEFIIETNILHRYIPSAYTNWKFTRSS